MEFLLGLYLHWDWLIFYLGFLKNHLCGAQMKKYICCLHIISIKYEDMLNAGAVAIGDLQHMHAVCLFTGT